MILGATIFGFTLNLALYAGANLIVAHTVTETETGEALIWAREWGLLALAAVVPVCVWSFLVRPFRR